jgi:AraC family transcriptional regulator
MSAQRGYGQTVAQLLRLEEAPSLVRQKGYRKEFAATLVQSQQPSLERSDPLPNEDAVIVSVSLCPQLNREVWLNQRLLPPQGPQPAGVATLLDLRHDNRVRFRSGFHLVHFYFTRAALNGALEHQDANSIDALRAETGVSSPDPTLMQLAVTLLPSLMRPQEASRVFVDHVMQAAAAHILKTYAGVGGQDRQIRGGLAPWQQKRATELLSANLEGTISLTEVAAECGLSPGHFARAFTQSMGLSPHRWLQEQRVKRAKALLVEAQLPLAEVAKLSGFADQSHFTRVFSKAIGTSPGAWRRYQAV